MYKTCSQCGKIHPYRTRCLPRKIYRGGKERELRNTHDWHTKAKQIREYAGYLCEVCKDQGIYTYSNLEVHHIVKLRDDESKFLDDDNLICLCRPHHKQADRNEINADYLRQLARQRGS